MRKTIHVMALCLATLVPVWNPVSASDYGLRVEPPRVLRTHRLLDQDSRPVSFPLVNVGWQLVIFGYTHCPDVCPMTLHKTSEMLKALGKDRGQVRVVFVSIDSTRDDVGAIRDFVGRFEAGITGLTGDAEALQAAANDFEVLTRRYQGKTAMAYRLEHSSYIYLLDPQGRLRMLFPGSVRTDQLTATLRKLWASHTAYYGSN